VSSGVAAIVVVVSSALIASAGIVMAWRVRVLVPKGVAPARWFAAPVPLLLALLVVVVVSGEGLVAVPLAATALLFAAASWTVAPTRRAHFARFEHLFWLHVADAERRERVPSRR